MSALTLTLATWDYDRTRPLLDGRVRVPGCQIVPVIMRSEDLFPRAFSRAEFDVSELSLSSHLLQLSRGQADYVALPVFVSRAFRHGSIYVRTDRGIDRPMDLEGKTVGVPEFQMTLALWVRGILQDEFGVGYRRMRWRTGGTNVPGRKERLPLDLPPEIDVRPIDPNKSLNELLAAGELDAVISPSPPELFTRSDPRVRRLFQNSREAERDYFRKTGYFPIMHLIGLRKSLATDHPGLASRLVAAFSESKRIAVADLDATAQASANRTMLPWFAEELEATRGLMGPDPWRYGVGANRHQLEAICRWSAEQHLSRRRLEVDELFAEETLQLVDEG